MSRVRKTLDKILAGDSDANVRFENLRAVLLHLGFDERVRGGHHIFTFDGIEDILNIQPCGSQAKAYQVRQVRELLTTYGLAGGSDTQDEN